MSSIGSMACPTHSNKALELKEHKKTYCCDGCNMDGKGPGYRCRECDYVLHPQCKSPLMHITPSFLQAHTFVFMKKPLPPPSSSGMRYCDACGMATKGFVYHCYKKGFDLHPRCASLESQLEIDGLVLALNKKSTRKSCDLCNGLESVEDSYSYSYRIDHGWFYAPKNRGHKCYFHVHCIMNMANKSVDVGGSSSSSGTGGMDLSKLESLPVVKKRIGGNGGNKYWRILKAVITYVIAIVFGDPTMIVAKLFIEGVVHLGELL